MYRFHAVAAAFVLIALGGCTSTKTIPTGAGQPFAPSATYRSAGAATPITHLIVVVQEDRSFNNLFAGYPGANDTLQGQVKDGSRVALTAVPLAKGACDRLAYSFAAAFDGGKMDGFDRLDPSHPLCPYTHVRRSDDTAYWNLAKHYALADKMFEPTFVPGDFIAHQYLIAGSTRVKRGEFVIDQGSAPGGCFAPPGTTTTILIKSGYVYGTGPFPCFTYKTIASLLDAKGVSWKYYVHDVASVWDPFVFIKYVAKGPDWKKDISSPETNVFSDLKGGTLAQVSWVTPDLANSDFPGSKSSAGPAWVTSLVDAVKRSSYWNHAAIIVLWDDAGEGQFYDNAPPPQVDFMGLGFRVPMTAISPYAKRGYVSHTVYETGGSTLKFIEDNWNLGRLGTTDVRANSIADMFTFK